MVNNHIPDMSKFLQIVEYIMNHDRYDIPIQRDNNLWKSVLLTLKVDKRIKKLATSKNIN